jgi:hypothetical protein
MLKGNDRDRIGQHHIIIGSTRYGMTESPEVMAPRYRRAVIFAQSNLDQIRNLSSKEHKVIMENVRHNILFINDSNENR